MKGLSQLSEMSNSGKVHVSDMWRPPRGCGVNLHYMLWQSPSFLELQILKILSFGNVRV